MATTRAMPNRGADKVDRQLDLLDSDVAEGRIAEADGEAIRAFIRNQRGQKEPKTLKNYLTYTRSTAKRSDTPLTDLDVAGIENLLNDFRSGEHPAVKDDGIGVSNYQKTLRVFYRFHDELGVDPESIDIDKQEGRNLSPDDLLFQDDVDALLRACRNIRNKALIALMLATGQRLDAARTLRRKHVHMDGRTITVELNEEEGALKGASGTRPVFWAKHYVREWYESHPFPDDPEAALWCNYPDAIGSNEPQSEDREPLEPQTVRDIVNRAAARSGIGKNVYPHLFRHTAITREVLEDTHPQQIKRLVGWNGDSEQFDVYVTLADQMNNDALREAKGLPTSEEGVPTLGRPTLERCPECNEQLQPDAEICKTCQTPFTHSAAEQTNESDADDGYAGTGVPRDRLKDAVKEGVKAAFEGLGDMPRNQRNAVLDSESADIDDALDTLADNAVENLDD
jgi:integrase/recombinase XerD